MTKNGKRNIRGYIFLISSIVIVFLIMPLALWKGCIDSKNLKVRGKTAIGRVIGVTGFKEDKTRIEYYIGKEKFVVLRDAPSYHKKNIGDSVKLVYDSLNYENVIIIW